VLIATAVAALATAPALGSPAPDGTAALSPNTTGAASHLKLDVKGQDGGLRPKVVPSAFALAFQKGFTLNAQVVSGVCTADQASNDQCPETSRLAKGTIAVAVNGQNFTATFGLFRADPVQSGDPSGIAFTYHETSSGFHGGDIGRLHPIDDPVYGTEIRIDPLPLPKLPPGLTITLNELQMDAGAGTLAPAVHPVAKKKKRKLSCTAKAKRIKNKRKRRAALHRCAALKRRHSTHHTRSAHAAQTGSTFIQNPPDCSAGAWMIRVEFDYGNNGNELRDASAPCAAARR